MSGPVDAEAAATQPSALPDAARQHYEQQHKPGPVKAVDEPHKGRKKKKKKKRTWRQCLTKYCCAGQMRDHAVASRMQEPAPEGSSWLYANLWWRRPHWVTVVLPLVIVYTAWLSYMSVTDSWGVFGDRHSTKGYYMTIMMVFGSMVAGATSEGGGSVAFPIMTLVFGLTSSVARDFSLMIQSVGMTSGAFTILYSQIKIEHLALRWSSAGGLAGIWFGLWAVAPRLPSDYSKMIFVSVFLAFAANLFYLNTHAKRVTHVQITAVTRRTKVVLGLVGFGGGILSSIAGSGIDIFTFSVLTLYFRVSEKTATPTSVVLMAGNTVAGFFWRAAVQGDIEAQTWDYWLAAVPAVCVGAPLGAFLSSFLHRQVLASFVYVTDSVQFIAACVLTTWTALLGLTTVLTLGGATGFFVALRHFGNRRLLAEIGVDPSRPRFAPLDLEAAEAVGAPTGLVAEPLAHVMAPTLGGPAESIFTAPAGGGPPSSGVDSVSVSVALPPATASASSASELEMETTLP